MLDLDIESIIIITRDRVNRDASVYIYLFEM